jgi:large subunit ribosomal protein L15
MLNQLTKIGKAAGKRHGRGYGSGKGSHTSGRGTKGHKSRSGYKAPRPGFEGGQMPLSRRLPKLKGFGRKYLKKKLKARTINIADLNVFSVETVTLVSLQKAGMINKSVVAVKIVGNAKLTKKLNFTGVGFSKAAAESAKAAGGKIE